MSDNGPKNLESEVLNWVKCEGYPLEMRVTRAFREAGFNYVVQSDHYIDPQTGKLREADLLAYQDVESKKEPFYMAIVFFVECKVSKTKHWVIFSSTQDRPNPYLVMDRWMFSSFRRSALIEGEEIRSLDLFSVPKRLGYGITNAFLGGKDKDKKAAYTAMMQVTNHMAARQRDWVGDTRPQSSLGDEGGFPWCMFLIPVIVLDGRLFECYLDDTGEVVVSETGVSIVSWPIKAAHRIDNALVKILTVDSLPNFVQKANRALLTLSSHPRMQEMGLNWEKSERESTQGVA